MEDTVIRSTNLLSRPASEIFIHLAIKDIATIISLSFRSPAHRFRYSRRWSE
jgi:hypothetical protein